ncbi:MAG TPA: F0F1 ATP synthase subunit B [Stellaceae bacterium]|nr:F0F1 ATP synthase subunit B [Stellaceae bacterium]
MELLKDAEFWVLIAFVIAFGFLGWKVTPILTRQLDQRATKIRDEIEAAARLRDEAQTALAEYQRKQRDAMKEADAIIAHAREESLRAAERAEREIEAALERRRRMASEKITLDEAKAMAEVRARAVEIAIAAVRRALGETLDPVHRSALLDEAIAGLPRALH